MMIEFLRHVVAVLMIGIWFAGHVKLLIDAAPKQARPRTILVNGRRVVFEEAAK